MVVKVGFVIHAGLDVVDQQEAGKGDRGDGKPSGLHHDEVVADDLVDRVKIVWEIGCLLLVVVSKSNIRVN